MGELGLAFQNVKVAFLNLGLPKYKIKINKAKCLIKYNYKKTSSQQVSANRFNRVIN